MAIGLDMSLLCASVQVLGLQTLVEGFYTKKKSVAQHVVEPKKQGRTNQQALDGSLSAAPAEQEVSHPHAGRAMHRPITVHANQVADDPSPIQPYHKHPSGPAGKEQLVCLDVEDVSSSTSPTETGSKSSSFVARPGLARAAKEWLQGSKTAPIQMETAHKTSDGDPKSSTMIQSRFKSMQESAAQQRDLPPVLKQQDQSHTPLCTPAVLPPGQQPSAVMEMRPGTPPETLSAAPALLHQPSSTESEEWCSVGMTPTSPLAADNTPTANTNTAEKSAQHVEACYIGDAAPASASKTKQHGWLCAVRRRSSKLVLSRRKKSVVSVICLLC